MNNKSLWAIPAVFALVGCGGGTTSNVPDLIVGPPLPVTELLLLKDDYIGTYSADIDAKKFTSVADMPVQGGAAMSGVIGFHDVGADISNVDEGLIGQVDLVADFGAQTIVGTGSNFFYVDGVSPDIPFTGTLDIDADIETTATAGFSGTLQGAITSEFDLVELDMTIGGGFLGNNASGIFGNGSGTVVVDRGAPEQIGVTFIAD